LKDLKLYSEYIRSFFIFVHFLWQILGEGLRSGSFKSGNHLLRANLQRSNTLLPHQACNTGVGCAAPSPPAKDGT
jgi:hypothetical protein